MPPNTSESDANDSASAEENKRINTETIEMEAAPSTPTPFLTESTLPRQKENNRLTVILSTINLIANIFIGAIVGTVYMFAFRNGVPLEATEMHIVLCVTGYQLLMAQGIMTLAASNSWSSKLKLRQKRKVHLILQLLGSGLAIAGTFIKILDKNVHWDSTHGIFGLIALVFTSVSLINGCASFYAQELAKILPGNISKLAHVCFGTIAFLSACVTLCLGLDKAYFKVWATDPLAKLYISLTAFMVIIVITSPLATFKQKLGSLLKK